MERNKLIAVIAVIAILCVAGASYAVFSGGDDKGDGRPTLVVETSPDFAPFDYQIGGEYVGMRSATTWATTSSSGPTRSTPS